jgi:hypothetical protein
MTTGAAEGRRAHMDEERDKPGFTVTDRRRFARDEAAPSAGPAVADGERSSEVPPSWVGEGVTFSTFVLGLSTQALLHLGEIEDPSTGDRKADLLAAKQMIDILGVLDAKTRGNLEHNEEELLGGVLYDLRMRYVELVRRSPKGKEEK